MSTLTANVYKVQRKEWAKWSELARQVFNETYCAMGENQRLFLHPQARPLPDKQWLTTAWNAAWIAAHAVDDDGTLD